MSITSTLAIVCMKFWSGTSLSWSRHFLVENVADTLGVTIAVSLCEERSRRDYLRAIQLWSRPTNAIG